MSDERWRDGAMELGARMNRFADVLRRVSERLRL
jgi:hypothetical protein